ncbi:MAG: hypothetical protein RL748_159 [Pseudomonadota bacterium]
MSPPSTKKASLRRLSKNMVRPILVKNETPVQQRLFQRAPGFLHSAFNQAFLTPAPDFGVGNEHPLKTIRSEMKYAEIPPNSQATMTFSAVRSG